MPLTPFTCSEKNAIKDVLRHQRKFSPIPPASATVSEPSELNIVLDAAGVSEIVRYCRPAEGGEMDPSASSAAKAVGCRIIHNHPSQESLSAADWNVLAKFPLIEITAVNSRGTTFRGKIISPGHFQDWRAAVQSAYDSVSTELNSWIRDCSSQAKWDENDFALKNNWLVGKAIGERLMAKGYAEFECIPKGSDSAVLADPLAPPLETLLAQWCAAIIP